MITVSSSGILQYSRTMLLRDSTIHLFLWHSPSYHAGGHDSIFSDNVVVVRPYDGQACVNVGDYVPGHEQKVYNNTCVLPPQGSRGQPDLVAPSIGSNACAGLPYGSGVLIAYANRYYTLHDNATTTCDGNDQVRVVDLKPPMEAGSSSHPIPDGATIMAWGRAKIGL